MAMVDMECECSDKEKIGTIKGTGAKSGGLLNFDVYRCEHCGDISLKAACKAPLPTIEELVEQAKKEGGPSYVKDLEETEKRNEPLEAHYEYKEVTDGRKCENFGRGGPNGDGIVQNEDGTREVMHTCLILERTYVHKGKVLETKVFCTDCLNTRNCCCESDKERWHK